MIVSSVLKSVIDYLAPLLFRIEKSELYEVNHIRTSTLFKIPNYVYKSQNQNNIEKCVLCGNATLCGF